MLSNVQLFFSPKKPKHQTEKKLVENIAVSVLNVFVQFIVGKDSWNKLWYDSQETN
jgi:hypothetical protein